MSVVQKVLACLRLNFSLFFAWMPWVPSSLSFVWLPQGVPALLPHSICKKARDVGLWWAIVLKTTRGLQLFSLVCVCIAIISLWLEMNFENTITLLKQKMLFTILPWLLPQLGRCLKLQEAQVWQKLKTLQKSKNKSRTKALRLWFILKVAQAERGLGCFTHVDVGLWLRKRQGRKQASSEASKQDEEVFHWRRWHAGTDKARGQEQKHRKIPGTS